MLSSNACFIGCLFCSGCVGFDLIWLPQECVALLDRIDERPQPLLVVSASIVSHKVFNHVVLPAHSNKSTAGYKTV
jgi:hypothetical protein